MKKIFLILFIILTIAPCARAEKYPVKITPAQIISTHHDAIQSGDWIRFKTVNDVYVNNQLYIAKNTPVIGIVDQIHQNGFYIDNAEIKFERFITKTVTNKRVEINQTLYLNRKDYLTKSFGDKIVKYIGVVFRGSEILIEPESMVYNIFLEK